MVNGLLGYLAIKSTTNKRVYLTKSMNEASYHAFANNAHINTRGDIYEIIYRTEKQKDDNAITFWNQVLDVEAVELHKMKCLLEKHGGKLVYVNTDNAIAEFENKQNSSPES